MIQETIHSPKQQPPQPQPKRSKTKIFLKKSKKLKEKVNVDAVLQRLIKLEKKVVRMLKINHTDVIETSMQANMMNETIPITLYQTPSTSKNSFLEYDLKSKLHDMMLRSRSFLDHQKHLELYNALIESIGMDEAMAKSELDPVKTLKRHHDQDQDPPTDKDSKKRKRKDADTSSSKKEDKELLQDDVENDDGMVQHDDLAVNDMLHNNTSPKQAWTLFLTLRSLNLYPGILCRLTILCLYPHAYYLESLLTISLNIDLILDLLAILSLMFFEEVLVHQSSRKTLTYVLEISSSTVEKTCMYRLVIKTYMDECVIVTLSNTGFASALAVLVTGASQSKQHESRKSSTAELVDVDSGRISIHHCEY
ncbi:hypothetical protein Tco_1132781 [Tanacetum coccineum]|uniref:Uncharacterized protein n=1 Tax=Tanacetum coccineum TaxID=301880 RepID=A0ABQ5JEM0_9ASTR